MMHSLCLQGALTNWKIGLSNSKAAPAHLQKRINDNLELLTKGLHLYNTSFVSQNSTPRDLVAKLGSTKVFRYQGSCIPIIFIPSHINKSYILDFSPSQSLINKLKNAGLNPYLIEWGTTQQEQQFGFEDYFNLRLKPLIETVAQKEGRKVIVAGYCMGGLFALAGAKLLPNLVEGLITLATPWNFHATNFLAYPFNLFFAKMFSRLWVKLPFIPKEFIQLLFYFQDFITINKKYMGFAQGAIPIDQFIGIENWANDGVDMPAPLFLEGMQKLITENQTYLSKWQMNGTVIDPSTITQKSFCALSKKDKISPISSTLPLGIALRNCTLQSVESGHISMIISNLHSIAPELINWIKTNFR